MKNDIKNITGEWAGKLERKRIGDDPKRRIVINARVLFQMLPFKIDFSDFCRLIEQSPLRQDIDYQYTKSKDTMLLSISAMQALLVMCNTHQSWQLYHSMTDLINKGFSNT